MRTLLGILAAIVILAWTSPLQAQFYTPGFFPTKPGTTNVQSTGVPGIFNSTMAGRPNGPNSGGLSRYLPSLPTMNPQNVMLGRTTGTPAPAIQSYSYPANIYYPSTGTQRSSSWFPWAR